MPPHLYTEEHEGTRYKIYPGHVRLRNGYEYTTGQDCCDLCAENAADVRWVSWGRPGTARYPNCVCHIEENNPGSANSNSPSYNAGSCTNTQSTRKKRNIPTTDKRLVSSTKRIKRDTQETDLELAMRSYGSQLRYECGLARMFYDTEAEDTYVERWMTCNWNKTWTRHDTIDECMWVQCLYPPPEPEGSNIVMTWDNNPVEFMDNVSYVCSDDQIRFEWDREMTEFNVTCLPGGSWTEPEEWPICLLCKFLDNLYNIAFKFGNLITYYSC